MARNYCANQYDSAFKANSLQNWETGLGAIRKDAMGEMPKRKQKDYVTKTICDLNGNFVDPKFRGPTTSAYGNFAGTWDLPRRLPLHPHVLNTTARNPDEVKKHRLEFAEAQRAVLPNISLRACTEKVIKYVPEHACQQTCLETCRKTASMEANAIDKLQSY